VYQDRAAAETDAIAQWIALGLSDGLTGQLTSGRSGRRWRGAAKPQR